MVTRSNGSTFWQAAKTLYMNGNKAVRVTGSGKTRGEAWKKLSDNETRRKVMMGKLPASAIPLTPTENKTTFEVVAWEWHSWKKVQTSKAEKITPNVAKQYERSLNNHILPALGKAPIRLLSRQEIEHFLTVTCVRKKKQKRNPDTGVMEETEEPLMGLSHRRAIQGVINQICRYAVKREIILEDPTRHITPIDKPDAVDKHNLHKRRWVVREILAHIAGTPDEARWILACLGVRKSERLGLTWDCFTNLGKKGAAVVEIRQQLLRNPDTGRLEIVPTTKSVSSKRLIPLDERVRKVLFAHKKRQEEMMKSSVWKQPVEYEGLVYTTSVGTPISHNKDNEAWHRLISAPKRKDGSNMLPYIPQHSMRHIAISILVSEGVPIEIVTAIAGHANVSITRAVYTHLSTQDKKAPIKTLTDNLYRHADGADRRVSLTGSVENSEGNDGTDVAEFGIGVALKS